METNEYEDYSDSDESDNGRIDDDDWLQALSIQQRSATQDGGQWTYLAHSQRGSLVYGSNRTRIIPKGAFKLQFNSADEIKLGKARIEIRHSFNASKRKLNIIQDRPLSPTESLMAVVPRDWILSFDNYLESALGEFESKSWCFDDVVVFFVGDIMMRHHTCSAAELRMYGMTEEDFKCFQIVRKALTKVDVATQTQGRSR